MSTCTAFIPARAGSKRIHAKNIRDLNGYPMIAYTIHAAKLSGVFKRIIVSTDSEEIAVIARKYGAEVPFLRPDELAGEKSPDIEWVLHALQYLKSSHALTDCISILRPTSPFRTFQTIQRAWDTFSAEENVDSLRAVQKCTEHPGKMWVVDHKRMTPLLTNGPANPPWHSTPYQALPPVYVQNASLEICWSRVPLEMGTIAGNTLVPFITEGYEGYDINHQEDWWIAERLISEGLVCLPTPTIYS